MVKWRKYQREKIQQSGIGKWLVVPCLTVFLYPNGFPPEVIELFIQYTGRTILGNKAASGNRNN